jgi:hypothetical protein
MHRKLKGNAAGGANAGADAFGQFDVVRVRPQFR